ncbi:MAG: efflux transporter outer membrane subunit [Janthinobacterium lividum]
MRFSFRPCLSATAFAVLTACSTLPDYHAPVVETPAHFAGGANTPGWTTAVPADAQPRGPWWTVFRDPTLDALEARVVLSNQNLKKAVAQLQQARALIDYQHAGLLPHLTADVSTVPYRTSANVVSHSLAGKTIPDHTLGVTASWEPDLFGRVHDAEAGARADSQASQADLEAVRLSVTGDLAADYFTLRSLLQEKGLVAQSVSAYAHARDVLAQQLAFGAIDASAVAQAEAQLQSARSAAADIDAQCATLRHAMATLLGTPASTTTIDAAPLDASVVPDIPSLLPSQLLQRRPDVAAAERRVAAANAAIGEAHAAFYPDLTLSGTAGLESTFLAPWFTAPSLFWSIGPQLVGTLFDGGLRRATLKNATAAYDGSVADYRQTVLVALQQVEDALSTLDALSQEEASQRRATTAEQLAARLTTNRFQAGAVDYLNVVTTQTTALEDERVAAQLVGRRMSSSVRLIEALGGGWQGG